MVDLKLIGASGLECVKMLHAHDPAMKIVVLTGFASIATAVEAIKLGACHYLAKPSNADDIEAAFGRGAGDSSVGLSPRPSSIKTLEWERIHEILVDSEFNISEAARRLGMHRRTLARKLVKRRVDAVPRHRRASLTIGDETRAGPIPPSAFVPIERKPISRKER